MFSNEEIQLEFKRFPAEKQEQIRQLVAYTTLMGLDGKDLISIGGRLGRIAERNEINKNLEIIESLPIRSIGKDRNCRNRWGYVSADGTLYHFSTNSYANYKITNTVTNKSIHVNYPGYYDRAKFGRGYTWKGSHELPIAMMEIHRGNIQLP